MSYVTPLARHHAHLMTDLWKALQERLLVVLPIAPEGIPWVLGSDARFDLLPPGGDTGSATKLTVSFYPGVQLSLREVFFLHFCTIFPRFIPKWKSMSLHDRKFILIKAV